MLAVFLSVLKIIGISILVILLVAVFLLVLVLFVPVRYRIDGTVPKTMLDDGFDKNDTDLKIKFHWLLHILSGRYEYPADDAFTVRIFGIKVYPRKEKADKDSEEKNEKKSHKKSREEKAEDNGRDDIIREDMESGFEEVSAKDRSEAEAIHEEPAEKPADQVKESEEPSEFEILESDDEEDFVTLWDAVDAIISFVLKVIKTPQNVFSKIKYTISRVCGKINMIRSTLESDTFARAYDLVKAKLYRILRMISPDKSDVKLMLGVGDPAIEGDIMALYGIMYPVLYDKVSFMPDFEQKVVQADVHIKGHITAFTVLYCVCVCYFNKDVKKIIGRFKKISAM